MDRINSLESSISYFTPSHGRTESGFNVPESHKLFICPSACGRRHAIHALSNGEKDAVSFLYITEADVVTGRYEQIIGDAIGELLTELKETPRAFIVYFNCIDDFLGTDEQALVKTLHERYPSVRFTICHIDPVAMDDKIKPGMRINSQIYGLLEYTGKKDSGINIIGSLMPVDVDSELANFLSSMGVSKIRQLCRCKTFGDFLELADSRLNLVMSPMSNLAARNMADKLDIPYFINLVSYDIEEIVQAYNEIANLLGAKAPDKKDAIDETLQTIQNTLKHIGNIPILIDSSATMQPFAMAKALCLYGFNVQAVFSLHMRESDWNDRKWLEINRPQVLIFKSQSYKLAMDTVFERECIAIGFDIAYTVQSNHFVDILHDESFYGFEGIRKLMMMICEAYDSMTNWEQIKERDEELKRL
jgi:nitrogenase molybdenum-iron protein alpha/beta subunit